MTSDSQTQNSKGIRDSKILDSGKQVPPGDIILSARAVSLARDGVELLHGISADIRRGSVTMLLGHNGAGKTLLLNCLHGLIRHDGGRYPARRPRARRWCSRNRSSCAARQDAIFSSSAQRRAAAR